MIRVFEKIVLCSGVRYIVRLNWNLKVCWYNVYRCWWWVWSFCGGYELYIVVISNGKGIEGIMGFCLGGFFGECCFDVVIERSIFYVYCCCFEVVELLLLFLWLIIFGLGGGYWCFDVFLCYNFRWLFRW